MTLEPSGIRQCWLTRNENLRMPACQVGRLEPSLPSAIGAGNARQVEGRRHLHRLAQLADALSGHRRSSPCSRPIFSLFPPCSRGHGRRDRPRAGAACDDYRTVGLVIEARIERVVEPPVGGDAAAVRHGVTGLEQIDDDGVIRAATGQNAADRSRQPKPAPRRDEFLQRRASRGEARWEEIAIPGGHHDGAAIAGELVREVTLIMALVGLRPSSHAGRAIEEASDFPAEPILSMSYRADGR